ncbi:MAG: hypothetical protein ACYDCD_13590 [Candidatus Acidiferrales bacterium]
MAMNQPKLHLAVPDALVADFASDPLSPYEKVLHKSDDKAWPLYEELKCFLQALPAEAIEIAYSDATFVSLYGMNDRLARIWFTQNLLIEEVARRRLKYLVRSDENSGLLPYSTPALSGLSIDDEQLIRLSDFEHNGSTVAINGFSFVVCSTNRCANSTHWLLQSFYIQGVSAHVRVRLDPFLWGPSGSFPQMMYKMLVYAKPLNWDGIARLQEPRHGEMRPDKPWDRSELTQFCWTPRDDGIHFVCEELPRTDSVEFEGARYLHAIYDPRVGKVTHLDAALRIYTAQEIEIRREVHVRNSGKSGLRRKIFRTDLPINREAFSLIAQAFFIWNNDLAIYFRETLSQSI